MADDHKRDPKDEELDIEDIWDADTTPAVPADRQSKAKSKQSKQPRVKEDDLSIDSIWDGDSKPAEPKAGVRETKPAAGKPPKAEDEDLTIDSIWEPKKEKSEDELWKEILDETEKPPPKLEEPSWLTHSKDSAKPKGGKGSGPAYLLQAKMREPKTQPKFVAPTDEPKPDAEDVKKKFVETVERGRFKNLQSILLIILFLLILTCITIYFAAPQKSYEFLVMFKDNVLKYRGDAGGNLVIENRGSWRKLEDGFEIREIKLKRSKNLTGVTLVCVRMDTHKFTFQVFPLSEDERSLRPGSILKKLGAAAVINGGFYDHRGDTIGLLMVDHRELSSKVMRGELGGVIGIKGNTFSIVDRLNFRSYQYEDGLQSGPWLVRNGLQMDDYKEPWLVDRRAAVCVDSRGRVVFAATDAVINGLSFSEFSHMLARSENNGGIGCVNALNLDGGSSVIMGYKGSDGSGSIRAYTKHPVVIAAFKK